MDVLLVCDEGVERHAIEDLSRLRERRENMRRITAWVAIVAVPTAVTGFFGQNVSYPGSGTTAGFIVSTLIIITSALVLFITFKRKGWL